MLAIEDYIAQRKKEDGMNEFDLDKKGENTKLCIDYVFEYFNNYLNISKVEQRTVLHNEKLDKYHNQISAYSEEVQEWLLEIYDQYNKQLTKQIKNILKKDHLFFLYNKDSEFRSVSYECYSQLVKKMPFLKQQTEMLFLFIKDYHRVCSEKVDFYGELALPQEITEWLESVWKKYQVNLYLFAYEWVYYFIDHEELWDRAHKVKDTRYNGFTYDVTKGGNLFNLDALYRKIPKKSFIKGRKQEFEVLMLHCWFTSMDDTYASYWDEYLEKVESVLQEEK